MQNVREEQKDLEDVKRDASERIARQERRVEDAARQGTKEIIEEQRDVEDAKRAEAQRIRDNTLPPRDLNDTTPITPAPIP